MATREAPNTLDPLLCFAVYSLDRKIGRIYQDLLAPWQLSYTQYLVLVLLWAAYPEPATMRDLGHELDLDSGTLSPLLKRLESRDLVTRTRSTADARVIEVHLTGKGERLEQELENMQQWLRERMPIDETRGTDLRRRVLEISALLPRSAV